MLSDAAAFGGHLFYDLFSQGQGGGHGPLGPLDPLLIQKAVLTDAWW